jgi:hypothetical protein
MTLPHRLKIYYAPLPDESTTRTSEQEGSASSSPPPPAALEYSQRAARLILEGVDPNQIKRVEMVAVGIEPLPDDASRLFEPSCIEEERAENKAPPTTPTGATTTALYLFIVSCAADGSVHRSVRQFARSLAHVVKRVDQQDSNSITSGGSSSNSAGCKNHNRFALTLLGHARCDNSAKQMADTIYSAGTRLEKSLLQVLPSVQRQQQQRQQQQQTMTTSSPINDHIGRCDTQVELEGPEVKFDPWIMTLAQSL